MPDIAAKPRSCRASRVARHLASAVAAAVVASSFVVTGARNVAADATDPCVSSSVSVAASATRFPGVLLCSNEDGNQAYSATILDCPNPALRGASPATVACVGAA